MSLFSKTSISFFVNGLSAHDSITFLFLQVSGCDAVTDDKLESFETAADDDNVDTLDVALECCGSSPNFSM